MITQAEYERVVPEKYRDKITIDQVKTLTDDDPEGICMLRYRGEEIHRCLLAHPHTKHECCCGFAWTDDN